MLERQYRVSSGGVAHEEADVRGEVALFVKRLSKPASVGLLLIRAQPDEAAIQAAVSGREPSLGQRERDQPCGIAIAASLERRTVFPLPLSDKRREAEPAVNLLLADRLIYDGLPLGGRQKQALVR